MRIETEADLARAAAALVRIEPRFAQVVEGGALRLRRRAPGFAALLFAITGQQVSVASAAAVWTRLETAGLTREAALRAASEEALLACGLSAPKRRYARALAEARLDWAALDALPDAALVTALTALPGIGRWTAEIYGIFALGRADMFPAGDLAMQEGARRLFDLPERPREAAFRAMAEAWRPYRAVAARALWDYYLRQTQRKDVP